MGKVGQFIVGGILLVGGVVVGIATGQWGIGFAISSHGLGLIYNAAQGERTLNQRQGAIFENRAGSKQPLPVIYGKTRVGPVMADMRVDDNSYKRKRMVAVCSFCHGSEDGSGIEAIDEIYLDDILAWNGSVQAPFNTAIDDAGDSYQSTHLDVTVYLGTDAQTVDPTLTALFGTEWPSTSAGKRVAYAVLLMWYNPEIFGGGLPRINAVIRGQKVFDPRTSTTAYSTNAALAIRDFLASTVYGFDDEGSINDVTVEEAADYCDEMVVPYSGAGSQKRFEVGGWVDTGRQIRASLADLSTACRSTIVHVGGQWRIFIRQEQTASGLVLTPTNVVEGSWKYILPGSADAANSVVVNYIDPDRDYQIDSIQWPEPDESNPLFEDDSSYLNQSTLDLPFTDDRLRAQQIGMVVVRESREAIAVLVSAKEEFLQAEIGDIVAIDHPSPGWSGKPFWIIATNYRPHDSVVDLILAEYESSVYTLDEQFPQPTIADTNLPDPFSIAAPTGLILTSTNAVALVQPNGDRIPRIRVQWTLADDPYVDHYEVEAKRSTDSVWDAWGYPKASDTEFFIVPVNEGETWNVRMFAVNRLGKRSTALSDSTTVTAVLGAPKVVSAVPDISSEGDVSISIKVSDALSVKIAHDLTAFPTKETTQGKVEIAVDSESNLQTLLRNIAEGESLYISILAYEAADGTGNESADPHYVKSNERETNIFQDEDVVDGFSSTRNASAPENGTVVFTAHGVGAYSNLEDANDKKTTYVATVTVDWNKNGTLTSFVFVDLYYSDAATGGSFWLADRVVGYAGLGSQELELYATVALDTDYDLRLNLYYEDVPTDGGKTEVTAHGEDSSPPGVQYKKKALRVNSTRLVLPVGTDLWEPE